MREICRQCRLAWDKSRRDGTHTPQKRGPAPQTHCNKGHLFTEENTYFIRSTGKRTCRRCSLDRTARYRAANPNKYADRIAEYKQATKAQKQAYNRAWNEANPERRRLLNQITWARRRAAGTITPAMWQAVLDRYGSNCLRCGRDEPPTIDHVIPVSRGGLSTVDNLQPLCMPCNHWKHTQIIDYRPDQGRWLTAEGE